MPASPKRFVLLLGGARAGKSTAAERLARTAAGRVLVVATAEAGDEEMRARIARHRADRPADWATLEAPRDPSAAIEDYHGAYDTLIFDCMTLWVSNLMHANGNATTVETAVLAATDRLLETYTRGTASWIVVSNEVGLGIVPTTPLGRDYRDLLGRVNQRLAARADEAYLVVAGRLLALTTPEPR